MENGWKLLYTCSTEIEATHIKSNLMGADIECEILSQVDSSRMFNLGELAIVKIYVREEKFDDAESILKDILNSNITDYDAID